MSNTYKNLEADLKSSKKRHAELAEQRESLKRGREESVSALIFWVLNRILTALLCADNTQHFLYSQLTPFFVKSNLNVNVRKDLSAPEVFVLVKWLYIQVIKTWCLTSKPIGLIQFKLSIGDVPLDSILGAKLST